MAPHFCFSSPFLYTPPAPLTLIFLYLPFLPFCVPSLFPSMMDWLLSWGLGPRCCKVAGRGTCTDGRGSRGWGWRMEAWICMCGLMLLHPPPPLHGKTGLLNTGSIGGGRYSVDWNIALGYIYIVMWAILNVLSPNFVVLLILKKAISSGRKGRSHLVGNQSGLKLTSRNYFAIANLALFQWPFLLWT